MISIKSIRLAFHISLFLFAFIIFEDKTLSLTDFQITKICRKEKRELTCIKNLQKKKSSLKKGNLIEIPVIPYKK